MGSEMIKPRNINGAKAKRSSKFLRLQILRITAIIPAHTHEMRFAATIEEIFSVNRCE
jgi:hypothetical protein